MKMKNSIITLFSVSILLSSCISRKNINTETQNINVITILPNQVEKTVINVSDTNLYNTYLVIFKNGQTQKLSYERSYNLFNVVDLKKIDHVDTLQKNIFWKEIY
jgi:protein involved in sex pheromone biosynthesis